MTSRLHALTTPRAGVTHQTETRHRRVGFTLAVIGLALAAIAFIGNVVASGTLADDPASAGKTLGWTFGLTTGSFATIKLGIGIVLVGILVRLWLRVDSVKSALPHLAPSHREPSHATGPVTTDHGAAVDSVTTPGPLPIHRMARTMWFPMLAMGFLAVVAGFFVSLAWAANPASVAARAWTQGLQFLGEGLLLAGIAFLLGSILGSLREGGGAVQEALGLTVRTLQMPKTAKAFVALMALGLAISVTQFALYVGVAASLPTVDDRSFQAWSAWLGPFRELGLALLLSGIVLALVTIGNVLGFQFDRIKRIVTEGR